MQVATQGPGSPTHQQKNSSPDEDCCPEARAAAPAKPPAQSNTSESRESKQFQEKNASRQAGSRLIRTTILGGIESKHFMSEWKMKQDDNQNKCRAP